MSAVSEEEKLIYDHHIDDLEESFNEYLHQYCPQAFYCIDMNDGRIVKCQDQKERKLFSRESKSEESISKYLNDDIATEE